MGLHRRNHQPAVDQTQRPGALIEIAQPLALVGSRVMHPVSRMGAQPRAIAIRPAPHRSCYTAEITSLLLTKRSVLAR
jgi:hypothetical protein